MKTRKPIVAGVLGTLASFYMIIPLSFGLFFGGGMYQTNWKVTVFMILAVISIIIGISGIVSYGFAFGRKRWRLTIFGSSCVIFTVLRMIRTCQILRFRILIQFQKT